MTVHFRKAAASQAKPLVGLYAESGCGKTKSALLLAKGFVGDMDKALMIETESGRGEAFAGDPEVGGYNVISLREDFSPKSYGAAITAAEQAGMQALIIDSASHEWEGAGGVLDMAAQNQAAGKKGVLVWQQPKILHAREFMLRLMQTSVPLVIVCMRAKYPMEEVIKDGRKDWVRSKELAPKQSEDILYEMFIHGWIDREHKFRGTKYTVDTLRQVLVDGERISVATGQRLAEWSRGTPKPAATPTATLAASGDYIGASKAADIETLCRDNHIPIPALLAKVGADALEHIPDAAHVRVLKYIDAQIAARQQAA